MIIYKYLQYIYIYIHTHWIAQPLTAINCSTVKLTDVSNAAIAQQNTETEDPQLTSFVRRRVGLQHVNQGVGQERSCLEKRLALERKGDLGKNVGKCMMINKKTYK